MIRYQNRKQKSRKQVFGFFYNVEGQGRAYYFLLIDALKKKILEAKLKKNIAVKLNDYGIVLASGYGLPSEDIKMLLRDLYGADI